VATSGRRDYEAFRRVLRRHAPTLARDLPWIGADPWAVLVSEVMLQQTQTSRVIGPWTRFVAALPTPTTCAEAPLSQVVRLWSGLGYHRRAKSLHDAATLIRDEFAGAVPRAVSDLRRLPGVGEYTANAVASFAFGERVAVVDTNVGRVLARALTNRTLSVGDARDVANELLPRLNAAAFNQAMLDLGAQHCTSTPRCDTCPAARVCRWRREGGPDPAPRSAGVSRPQPTFEGSDRQARGRVLAALRERPQSMQRLLTCVGDDTRGATLVAALIADGLVERRGRLVRLSGDGGEGERARHAPSRR
jgi:A/G-specific adenine glycosylase